MLRTPEQDKLYDHFLEEVMVLDQTCMTTPDGKLMKDSDGNLIKKPQWVKDENDEDEGVIE